VQRRRTIVAYATGGILSLAIALVLSATGGATFEGPGPLAFDPVLAFEIAAVLFLLGAIAFTLGLEPEWAVRDGAD